MIEPIEGDVVKDSVYRYHMSNWKVYEGVPAYDQDPNTLKVLVELHVTKFSGETRDRLYTGKTMWIGLAQVVAIEEVTP